MLVLRPSKRGKKNQNLLKIWHMLDYFLFLPPQFNNYLKKKKKKQQQQQQNPSPRTKIRMQFIKKFALKGKLKINKCLYLYKKMTNPNTLKVLFPLELESSHSHVHAT